MPSFVSFKDLKITFKPHPITNDLQLSKDEAAVKQAVINLIMTVPGERPFQSAIGSELNRLLFEQFDYGVAAQIETEIKKLAELIIKYKKIINSKNELLKVISQDLIRIKENFGYPRRTKIIDAVLNYDIEETIQKESVIITITLQGYIKRGALSNVKQQKRGGKGKSGIKTRDEDSVVQTLSVNTHTSVLFFSTEGLVYKIKAWKIPEGTSLSKGKSLFNLLQFFKA